MNRPAPSSNLRRLLALPAGERRLLCEAWWRLLGAACRLRFAPRRAVAQALHAGPAAAGGFMESGAIAAVVRAVARAAAHHLGPMTCLPRALALQKMLARRGFAARVAIGVRRDGERVAAHAWVETGGRTVGEPEAIAARFLPFVLEEKK